MLKASKPVVKTPLKCANYPLSLLLFTGVLAEATKNRSE